MRAGARWARVWRVAAVALVLIAAPRAWAGDYEKGAAAHKAGDYAQARRLWLPLAKQGNPQAQHAIGRLYEKGHGVERGLDEAFRWYRRAADQGHADSQYRVAVGYAYGLGSVSQDDRQAARWLHTAAENGHHKSQKLLSQIYQQGGLGIEPDQKKAEYWAKRARARKH